MGSIRRAPRSGRWEARWRDPAGKQCTKTFDAKADARAWVSSVETDVGRGSYVDPAGGRLSVAHVARAWLESNPSKRPSARARDETILRVHVEPALGKLPIGSVTRSDVRSVIERWSVAHAPRTVRRMFGVLRAVFTFAMDDELIARSPCRGVKLPAVEELHRPSVSADAVVVLAEALGVDYAPIAYLGAALGLRFGECAGLRVGRLDFMRRTVTVAEQITRGEHGRAVVGEPKSDASRRTLTVPAPLMEMLSEHLVRRGVTGADAEAFVFSCRAVVRSTTRGGADAYGSPRRRQPGSTG